MVFMDINNMEKIVLRYGLNDGFEILNFKSEDNHIFSFDLQKPIISTVAHHITEFLHKGAEATQQRMILNDQLCVDRINVDRSREELENFKNFIVLEFDGFHVRMGPPKFSTNVIQHHGTLRNYS